MHKSNMKEKNNNNIQGAVDILTNGTYTSEELHTTLALVYRALAYDYIMLDGAACLGKDDMVNALYAVESLIDGLNGRFIVRNI